MKLHWRSFFLIKGKQPVALEVEHVDEDQLGQGVNGPFVEELRDQLVGLLADEIVDDFDGLGGVAEVQVVDAGFEIL